MKILVITKDFGVIKSAEEPFNQERFDDLTKQLEDIGDTCYKQDCSFSLEDEKGNRVILNPFILRQAVLMVEK